MAERGHNLDSISLNPVTRLFSRLRKLVLLPFRPWVKRPTGDGLNLVRLGSPHGGKTLAVLPNLYGSTLLSGGAGEDISFDVAFLARFGGRVVLVDPTPRAIQHIQNTLTRIGFPSESDFGPDGTQPADSYDLSEIGEGQITYIAKALDRMSEKDIDLLAPEDPRHVSFSSPLLRASKLDEAPTRLSCKTISVQDALRESHSQIPSVVKLDIEGAALEALSGMLGAKIHPSQIIVEIEELDFPSLRNYQRARQILRLLKSGGYVLVSREKSDFTFVLKTHLATK